MEVLWATQSGMHRVPSSLVHSIECRVSSCDSVQSATTLLVLHWAQCWTPYPTSRKWAVVCSNTARKVITFRVASLPGRHIEKNGHSWPTSKLRVRAKNWGSGSVYICIYLYICVRFELKFSNGQIAPKPDSPVQNWTLGNPNYRLSQRMPIYGGILYNINIATLNFSVLITI